VVVVTKVGYMKEKKVTERERFWEEGRVEKIKGWCGPS